ncbi:FAD-linked oxidase C-terminal domain-containing protein [Hydrogenibacillus sp. N12]|uniref:FAD-binding oxidoreductase n=1 Tax=Hydrogenibacillus sp. N12 TaxID=2866627 RepID=UPI001C7E0B71|nr:FAD-linked oxidase C-terminal domain-containing protein [Hydrogenibacillus sp. N12]QZA32591.1 FAD-binding protein [Hydrogenibacillus sp. N12]
MHEGERPWLTELRALFPNDRVSTNPTVLEQHSHDESYHPPHLPDAVVFPESTEEVARLLRFANARRIPVIPFGVGSSLEGHVVPVRGGISLDLTRMNRILDVRPANFLVHVEAGMTRTALNRALARHGLFFSVDPGADATLGGMAATNASGTTAVRYGVMRDQVRGMTVVLADGRVIRLGGPYVKSSSGYDLKHLFLGSEGTLGVITSLWLRVFGLPEAAYAARATFPSVRQAVEAAHAMLRYGLALARVELVDRTSIRQMNAMKGTTYPEADTLFLEFHGSPATLEADLPAAEAIARDGGATAFEIEREKEARDRLWEARHHLAYAYLHAHPGKKQLATDVCVPLSALADGIELARRELEARGLEGGVLGHIGDGNFHTIVMIDADDPADVARAEGLHEALVRYALSVGGTATGEHGVGLGKLKYQAEEHGEALSLMQAIKRLIDPAGILNPGKKIPLPPDESTG